MFNGASKHSHWELNKKHGIISFIIKNDFSVFTEHCAQTRLLRS
jgi:hypothetical protein